MSSSDLIRWSAIAAMVGGVSLAIADLFAMVTFGDKFSETVTIGTYALDTVLDLIALILLLLALVGLYVRQAEVTGPLGLVGFIVAFVGTVLVAGFAWTGLFIAPYLAAHTPELLDSGEAPPGLLPTFIPFAVGWLLFGIASLRGRVYPRWVAILLIVGAVPSILPLTQVVLGVAVAVLGLYLFAGRDAAEAQQTPSVSSVSERASSVSEKTS